MRTNFSHKKIIVIVVCIEVKYFGVCRTEKQSILMKARFHTGSSGYSSSISIELMVLLWGFKTVSPFGVTTKTNTTELFRL